MVGGFPADTVDQSTSTCKQLDTLRMQLTAQHAKEIKILEQQLAQQARDLQTLQKADLEIKKAAGMCEITSVQISELIGSRSPQRHKLPRLPQ